MGNWNGVSMLASLIKSNPTTMITSDASGSWGCGVYWNAEWFQLQWVGPIAEYHITVKELTPIVIAASIWGPRWRGGTVLAVVITPR